MRTARAIIIGGGKMKASADLELALSAAEKTKGLSGRASIEPGEGMMFDSVGAYWMRGVAFPLDIAFATADGTILEVQHMPVAKPKEVMPLYRPKCSGAERTFEFPEGWLRKQGIQPGDRIVVVGS